MKSQPKPNLVKHPNHMKSGLEFINFEIPLLLVHGILKILTKSMVYELSKSIVTFTIHIIFKIYQLSKSTNSVQINLSITP